MVRQAIDKVWQADPSCSMLAGPTPEKVAASAKTALNGRPGVALLIIKQQQILVQVYKTLGP